MIVAVRVRVRLTFGFRVTVRVRVRVRVRVTVRVMVHHLSPIVRPLRVDPPRGPHIEKIRSDTDFLNFNMIEFSRNY